MKQPNEITQRARWARWVVVGIISLIIGGYFGYQQFSVAPPTATTLHELELPDVTRQLRRGSEWLGKVVIVNHWASWCPPCRAEIPILIDYQDDFAAAGVQIIGIAHEDLTRARSFGDEIGLNYPSLVAIVGGRDLLIRHGNTLGGLPYTAIFNRRGQLVHRITGELTQPQLHALVAPLL